MWIIMKSEKDNYSFVMFYIEGETGYSYEYAWKLATEMTLAMKEYRQNHP